MTLTAQLIELIESKAIGKKESEVASWFVLDAIANFVAGRNSEQGRILEGWYLDEPAGTSRTVFWMGASMHIQEVEMICTDNQWFIRDVWSFRRYLHLECVKTSADCRCWKQ